MLTHGNITLRKTTAGDLPYLLAFREEAWSYLHRPVILNIEDQQKWLLSLSSDTVPMTAINSREICGFFQWSRIDWINRSAMASWGLIGSYRGRRLGHELVACGCQVAIDIMNLVRLDAEILSANIASQKCAENAGFVREGNRRSAVIRGRERIDSYIYGIVV